MRVAVERRQMLVGGFGLLIGSPALAAAPIVTPPQIEGPFYPYDLPPEVDEDLVKLSADDAPALGRVVHVFGTVRGWSGRPFAGALIELWQADTHGKYRHPRDTFGKARDPRFQGYGRTLSDPQGGFRFRTIRPPAYQMVAASTARRAPHLHVAVTTRGVRRLTTQLYITGEPLNDTDQELAKISDSVQRQSLIRPYEDGSSIERGAQRVRYDLVVLV